MYICNESICTGCAACMNICPRDAITMHKGDMDKTVPYIDSEKCIECNMCKKVCPALNKPTMNKVKKVFAAWSKKKEDQQLSSSGGVATVFSRYMLNQEGLVYGAAFKNRKVQHISIDKANKINLIRGSKYVQSSIGYTYRKLKTNLLEDRQVLFIGTPCQVAGLKLYLKKDYSNLILVDLICHGVPPIDYLNDHLSAYCKDWDNVMFRGEHDFKITIYNKKNIIKQFDFFEDEYYKAFFEGLIFRESCYSCDYSCPQRCSDITIGDFWGLRKETLNNKYDGRVSVILLNTDKGINYFDLCKTELIYEKRDLKEPFCEEQTNLLHPSPLHKDRQKFEVSYKKYGFDKAVMKTSLGKQLRIQKLKGMIKRTLFGKYLKKILKKYK